MCTPSADVLNATAPVTVLPWVGAICAAPSGAGSAAVAFSAGAAAGCSREQATNNTVPAIARPRVVAFMFVAPRPKEERESSIVGERKPNPTR